MVRSGYRQSSTLLSERKNTYEDIQALAAKQVDAVLVGETMMRASKDANALQSMIQAGKIKVR